MRGTGRLSHLRNDLYCVECDVELYYTIPYRSFIALRISLAVSSLSPILTSAVSAAVANDEMWSGTVDRLTAPGHVTQRRVANCRRCRFHRQNVTSRRIARALSIIRSTQFHFRCTIQPPPHRACVKHCTLTRRAVARRSLIYCRLCTSLVVRLIVLCGIYCTNIDCIGETYCRPGPTTYCPRLKITPETLIFHDGL